jgi:hypothetical protein
VTHRWFTELLQFTFPWDRGACIGGRVRNSPRIFLILKQICDVISNLKIFPSWFNMYFGFAFQLYNSFLNFSFTDEIGSSI